MRRATVGLLAATLALGPASAAGAQPEPEPTSQVQAGERTVTGRTAIADGHVDMGPRFIDGAWTIQLRDDTVDPPVWRNLPDVVLHIPDAGKMAVPEDERFGFLGAAGTDLWLLPQVQQQGVLWPGWNTQDPEVATTVNREVTWRLHGVTGPGHFVLFLNADFGAPSVVFDSARPFPQETGIETNTHVHGNWAFTATGSYLLDVEMTATTTAGASVTDRDTLRVFVGSGDPAGAFAATPSGAPAAPSAPAARSGAAAPSSDATAAPGTGSTPAWLLGGLAAALAVAALVISLVIRARRRGRAPRTAGGEG